MWLAIIASAFLAVFAVTSARAQEAQDEGPKLPCPASGYAKPWFGMAGDNDGQLRGYEIASPCVGKELRDAAVAIGMGRWKPLGLKTLTTLRFQADGEIANEAGKMETGAKVDMGINFTIPAARLTVTTPKGPEIRAFNDKQAWNEKTPGEGLTPANKTLAARAPLIKLTPYGALWSVIEAEGHAKITKDARGQTVVTGASPYDGYLVSVTLDAKSLPIAATVKAEGKTYAATFADYSDKWESPYLFIFPSKITWTMNGKPMANLAVTGFHSNPYVVFPPPKSGS
jgi:hypothetical protein